MLTRIAGRLIRGSRAAMAHDRGSSSLRPRLDPLERRQLLSITIDVRYDYDTNHFFDTQAKKDLMQQVANNVGAALDDHLAAINPSGADTWTAHLIDPTTGEEQTIDNLAVPADTIIVYVGGRPLNGSESGQNNQLNVTSSQESAFEDSVKSRGKAGVLADSPTAYAPWGGSISFDSSHTDWYFGQDLSRIGRTQTDFVTVATHELGHLLGIGTAPSWNRYATPAGFTGPASEAANGGNAVPLGPGQEHWALGTSSDGTWALMDPASSDGRRTAFSDLDYAALQDIGWQVVPPARFQFAGFDGSSSSLITGPDGVITNPALPKYYTDGSSGSGVITVTRLGPADSPASVHYETFDGIADSFSLNPAVAGTEYTPVSGVLTFAPGETTKTFTVPVLDDHSGIDTGVGLALGDPSPGALLGSIATATLIIHSKYVPPTPTSTTSDSSNTSTVVNNAPTNQTNTSWVQTSSSSHQTTTSSVQVNSMSSQVNSGPVLGAIPIDGQQALAGHLVTFTAAATDADPTRVLTFSLDAGAPAGATIDPHTGVFTWTPATNQASIGPTTSGPLSQHPIYDIKVRVTDNGSPPLSDARNFMIGVMPPPGGRPSGAMLPNHRHPKTITIHHTRIGSPHPLSRRPMAGAHMRKR